MTAWRKRPHSGISLSQLGGCAGALNVVVEEWAVRQHGNSTVIHAVDVDSCYKSFWRFDLMIDCL